MWLATINRPLLRSYGKSARRSDAPRDVQSPADYKSAIQQIENLRYLASVRTRTLMMKSPAMAKQQATLPTAPTNIPRTAPAPAFPASRHSRPPSISNKVAPRNGPRMIPGRLKKKPIKPLLICRNSMKSVLTRKPVLHSKKAYGIRSAYCNSRRPTPASYSG